MVTAYRSWKTLLRTKLLKLDRDESRVQAVGSHETCVDGEWKLIQNGCDEECVVSPCEFSCTQLHSTPLDNSAQDTQYISSTSNSPAGRHHFSSEDNVTPFQKVGG